MSGLLHKVDVPPPTQAAPEAAPPATPESQASTWFWDEGVPGQGERPEWLKGKYGKVVDQAKAYLDAEKRLGAEPTPVPEDYDLTGYADYFDIEAPHMADLKNKAKELRLSEDALKSLVDPFANYYKSLMPDIDKEIEKLGPHADMKINTVNTWASNHLSEKALETLGHISHTAAVVELLDEIRQIHSQTLSRVPTNVNADSRAVIVTAEQVQQKITDNYERYKIDASYRQQLNLEMRQACGED
jgi:hypothetical protein